MIGELRHSGSYDDNVSENGDLESSNIFIQAVIDMANLVKMYADVVSITKYCSDFNEGLDIPDGAAIEFTKTLPLGQLIGEALVFVQATAGIANFPFVSLFGSGSNGIYITTDYTKGKRTWMSVMSPLGWIEKDLNEDPIEPMVLGSYADLGFLAGGYDTDNLNALFLSAKETALLNAYLFGTDLVFKFKKYGATTSEVFADHPVFIIK